MLVPMLGAPGSLPSEKDSKLLEGVSPFACLPSGQIPLHRAIGPAPQFIQHTDVAMHCGEPCAGGLGSALLAQGGFWGVRE